MRDVRVRRQKRTDAFVLFSSCLLRIGCAAVTNGKNAHAPSHSTPANFEQTQSKAQQSKTEAVLVALIIDIFVLAALFHLSCTRCCKHVGVTT